MSSSPLLATAELKTSSEEAPLASEKTPPVDLTPSVAKDLSAEKKPSTFSEEGGPLLAVKQPDLTPSVVKDLPTELKHMTPHLSEVPFLDEKGEPLLAASQLPERVTPSAKEQVAGATPSTGNRSAEETKASCKKPPARICRARALFQKGTVQFMVLVSLLYAFIASRLLPRVAGQPTEFAWTFSHLANSYLFIGTICLSKMRFRTVFFRVSYGQLLSAAATQFIDTNSGANLAALLTFYTAGLFGYGIAEYEYLASDEVHESIVTAARTFSSRLKPHENSFIHCIFVYGTMSLAIFIRIVSLVLFPRSVLFPGPVYVDDHENIVLIAVNEFSLESILVGWMWSGIMAATLHQEAAVISIDTMLYKVPACAAVFYLLHLVHSTVVGRGAALLTLWPVAMAMVGLSGYIYAHCKKMIELSWTQDGYHVQKSKMQNVLDEPHQKIAPSS